MKKGVFIALGIFVLVAFLFSFASPNAVSQDLANPGEASGCGPVLLNQEHPLYIRGPPRQFNVTGLGAFLVPENVQYEWVRAVGGGITGGCSGFSNCSYYVNDVFCGLIVGNASIPPKSIPEFFEFSQNCLDSIDGGLNIVTMNINGTIIGHPVAQIENVYVEMELVPAVC